MICNVRLRSFLACVCVCSLLYYRGTSVYSLSRRTAVESAPNLTADKSSGNIRPIRRTLHLVGWEQSSPVDGKKKKKWMTVSLGSSLASYLFYFFYLLTCGRSSLVSETQNEIVVSWITLWGVMKVYWLDFSLHFRSCCLLRVCRKFGPKLASHLQASWEWSKVWTVRTIFGELKVQLRNES